MRLFLLCIFFSLSFKATYAQYPIATKMNWYGKAKSSSNLFVHFDKNVYANNETIWFTGYLLKQNLVTFNKHEVLAVSLVRDIDSTIVIQDKFFIQDGFAFGNLTIPDSLLTGDYHLMAHTDVIVNGKPDALFLQAITIKTNIEPSFKASLKILKAADLTQKNNQILLAATSKEGYFLPKPTTINYKYGNVSKNTKTDASGQLLIDLPLQAHLTDPNLYVKLKYQKDSSFINIPLTPIKQSASVKFYAEGGNMVNGLASTVGWEVKDQHQMPLPVYAFLYRNDQVIDTIETNSYGIGKFKITPIVGVSYTVKLQHDNLVDSIYILPPILNKGLVMAMENAVVADTLKLNLRTNDTRKINIHIHNFRESYLHIPFDMELNRRSLKIPLTEIPKGLTALTITDSVGKPLAERIFFAHYSNEERINIKIDQSSYKQREKVTLKVKLSDHQEQAVVSIACIQDNRIEIKKMNDIESFAYLNSELASLPTHLQNRSFVDKAYLEQVLFIKGWRKYSWQELNQITAADTILMLDSLRLSGQIKKSDKDLSTPVEFAIFGGTNLLLSQTDQTGYFTLQNQQLLRTGKNSMFLSVNNSKKYDFHFKIKDNYLASAKTYAKYIPKEHISLPPVVLNNSQLLLKNDEKAIRLREVAIFKKNADLIYGSNSCGDYVCSYNILNCLNHVNDPNNTNPIIGKSYMINNYLQPYVKCKPEDEIEKFGKINGINLHKQFYLDDYKEPEEPAFFSTIYWNYATMLNANKETELNFYTSDITGRFRIVVQGITNKDVVYAEQFFEVKK